MSDIDTAAIVATIGTIAALVVIALFLRWCGRGKDIPTNNPGTGSKSPTMIEVSNWEGMPISATRQDLEQFTRRLKNISDTGSGVTDDQMERIVSAVDDKEE
jgi:hypothetical protein